MSKRILPVLLVASSLVALIGCGKEDEREKKALNLPTGTPKRPQGAEALTVRPGAAEPFTKADVEAYFKARNIPKNAGSPDQFLVDSLEFITSKEVSQRLQGASTGLDDADRVGFATLSGGRLSSQVPKEGRQSFIAPMELSMPRAETCS